MVATLKNYKQRLKLPPTSNQSSIRGVDIQRFYATLSKHMPDWSYLYIPPKSSMKAHSEGNLDYPQLYYRGKWNCSPRSRNEG
jgi:hypothetical protein